MPAFEDFDDDNVATFSETWDQVKTVTMPDFSGERVAAYVKWKNVSKYLGYIRRAFPTPSAEDENDAGDRVLAQSPKEFNRNNLSTFGSRCDSKVRFDFSASMILLTLYLTILFSLQNSSF